MTDFFAEVADSCGATAEDVRASLDRHGVRPWTPPPESPALTIKRITFSGTKLDAEKSFEFDWALGSGVWAISSEANDVGKSSVLQVVRWLLSGRDDVDSASRAMIQSARLEFLIGAEVIVVSVEGARGDERGMVEVGATEQPFVADSFESIMEEIMLTRLGLKPLMKWKKFQDSEDGRPSHHGWTAFIPALFLPPPSSDALLGKSTFESGTLLQVFLGLPWYGTERQADVALKQVGVEERDETRRASRDKDAEEANKQELERSLEAAREDLRKLPDLEKADHEFREAIGQVNLASQALLEARESRNTRQLEAKESNRIRSEAERELRVLKETLEAGSIFGELNAEVCPRCEVKIGEERRDAETSDQVCMVCGRVHKADPVDERELLAKATEKSTSANAVAEDATKDLKEAERLLRAAEDSLEEARATAKAAEPSNDLHVERRRAEVEVARAEGALGEASSRSTKSEAFGEHEDRHILKAAKKVAKKKIDDSGLLGLLNEEILKVAHRFGLTQIDAVKIDRRSSLPVFKGEVKQSFSDISPSEKLRLRIATVIALLRVTQEGKPGRHPGLLVIDSPASDEVSDDNLDHMFTELVGLAAENERLQILIATTRFEAAADALEDSHILFVPHGEYAW